METTERTAATGPAAAGSVDATTGGVEGTAAVTAAPDREQWAAYRDVYAFVGRELLTPMNRSHSTQGLDPDLWEHAPVPCNEAGRSGLARLQAFAQRAQTDRDAAVLATSVDFTHLFIGPPRPAAAPWETLSDPANEKHVGYGRATVAMQNLLREEGLQLGGTNRQYEDHMGIELLYLSVLCDRGNEEDAEKARMFIVEHPRRWIGRLRHAVDVARPGSYYSALLEYVQGVLDDQLASLGVAVSEERC